MPPSRVLLAVGLCSLALATKRGIGSEGVIPRAVDVQTLQIYHAAERPGWACWPTAWQDEDGTVYVAFQELRRAPNPKWQPVPLDFWETIGLPNSYAVTLCGGTETIVPESVVMKSTDGCRTWREVGRDDQRGTSTFAWHSLPGGRIMRIVSNDYLAWGENRIPRTYSETSSDGGTTWDHRVNVIEGYSTDVGAYRLRILNDGTLAAIGNYQVAWQPGQRKFGRNAKRPHVRQEIMCALWFSGDGGKSWTSALPVLPGVSASEADFCELSSGDLLIANSAVQHGPQVRQYVRKTKHGWVPEPVFDVAKGRVPERLALSPAGIIVGAVRGGVYTCSNDEGATWHEIAGVPNAYYQPFTIPLADGRFFTVWHAGGGDEPFGTKDLWIGAHVFRLEAQLPRPTRLVLERQQDTEGNRYINAFLVTLTCGDAPLAGQSVSYRHKKRYGGEGTGQVTTNDKGQATIDLTKQFEGETNVHEGYTITASFQPAMGDVESSACQSDEIYVYAITTTRQELGWK